MGGSDASGGSAPGTIGETAGGNAGRAGALCDDPILFLGCRVGLFVSNISSPKAPSVVNVVSRQAKQGLRSWGLTLVFGACGNDGKN